MIAFAESRRIPVAASAAKPYSMDRNLLHISYESGVLEDPWFDASAESNREMYTLSVAPEEAPDRPEFVSLAFDRGNCVGLAHDEIESILAELGHPETAHGRTDEEHVGLSPFWCMKVLNHLGGRNGIGRVDMVENRFVGMKSRGVYETPGGTILFSAHRLMESLTMDHKVMHLRDGLIPEYGRLVYNGFWFSPERESLQALVTETQKNVTGVIKLKLYKGNVIVAGRKSPNSLYRPEMATMEADPTEAYNQSDATGFIRLNALRLKVAARLRESGQGQ